MPSSLPITSTILHRVEMPSVVSRHILLASHLPLFYLLLWLNLLVIIHATIRVLFMSPKSIHLPNMSKKCIDGLGRESDHKVTLQNCQQRLWVSTRKDGTRGLQAYHSKG